MTASDSPIIGRHFGRFQVQSPLGRGGLASVWRARDPLLGRDVALKILDARLMESPKARRRFVREAQAAALLDHPAIVSIFDAGETDGLAWIALTLVEGQTVSDLASQRLMAVADAVRIGVEAGGALAHAHANSVLHRDVTGRNIMVARDGRVFVLDFGLALLAGQSRLTSTETTLGTIAYMPPEAMSAHGVDERGDVYGLGVVLFEALTGTLPFEGGRAEAVAFAKLNEHPRGPGELRPEIAEPLDAIVRRAIARDPDARFATMNEMATALRGLAVLPDAGAAVPPPRDEPGRTRSAGPAGFNDAGVTRPDPAYLAILPFEAVGDGTLDAEQMLAARLPGAIGAAIGTAERLHVVPIPGAATDIAETGERLLAERVGANLLMRGAVARFESRMRVTYSLRDPWRGVQVAGGVVDGTCTQPFDLEDAVVASVRQALGIAHEPLSGAATRPADAATEDRFRIACRYLERYDVPASVDGAVHALEELTGGEQAREDHWAVLARAYLARYRLTKERVWEGRAASACAKARLGDGDGVLVQLAIADLEISTGRAGDALTRVTALLDAEPDHLEANLLRARAAVAGNRNDVAIQAAQHAARLRPDDWRGHNWLGMARFQCADYAGAERAWQKVVQLVPDSARGQMNLGSALYRLDRLEEAAIAYRASVDIHPTALGYTNLGTALYYLDKTEAALDAFERAAALQPSDPVMLGNLGNACFHCPGHEERGRDVLQSAIAIARDRLDANPRDASMRARLAGWLANMGLHDQALDAIERALNVAPEDATVLETAGHVFFQRGDPERAVDCIREAMKRGYGAEELRRSRELAPLREHPELRALLAAGQHGQVHSKRSES